MKWSVIALMALIATWLTACTVGPKYQRPVAQAPEKWSNEGPWRAAAPKDAIPKGVWWEIFHDEQLNQYEQELLRANQSLIAAQDRLSQARSLATVASAGLFPTMTVDPAVSGVRYSGNRPGNSTPTSPLTQSVYAIPFALNYEVDLFGRIRKTLEAANANLQSTAADLQSVQLVLTAELAADYFSLRELDTETQVVQDSIAIEQRGLDLVNSRHEGGLASGLDLAQQQTLLDSTTTQLYLVQQQRASFEHAIAVLTGIPAPTFKIAAIPLNFVPPPVPLGVPSDMLERRPDVASAERHMAQQNALVGVAKSAFYPQFTIAAGGGFQSISISSLLTAPSAFWAVGGDLLQPILNGGRNRANLAATQSAYDESVANYRQSVLTAFQQVEDGLSSLDALSQAAASQSNAVNSARRSLELSNNRYIGGVASYLDVITAQVSLLNSQRLATQLLGQQMVTSVYLVKALGGGWDASQIQNDVVRPKAIQAIQQ
ncbi:MAG TPA: efflux transporter outer membrane subunit [Candidatus Binatia bacterium]|jgi:NodT family efflux transporter outer membrane factor (OMF) lipoprotein|nr:efflux transporter outer membrane subunit [Candidatus Binatia bacterium]